MEYKNVLFDLGGVLMDLDLKRQLKAFAALKAAPSEKDSEVKSLSELLGGDVHDWMVKYEIGSVTTDQFVGAMLQYCKSNTTPEQVKEAWNSLLCVVRESQKAILRELDKKGKNIYVISNNNELHMKYNLELCPELKLSKQMFFSNEMGIAKPSPESYKYVIREAGIRPEETVYVDDVQANLDIAGQLGFQCLLAKDDGWMGEL